MHFMRCCHAFSATRVGSLTSDCGFPYCTFSTTKLIPTHPCGVDCAQMSQECINYRVYVWTRRCAMEGLKTACSKSFSLTMAYKFNMFLTQ